MKHRYVVVVVFQSGIDVEIDVQIHFTNASTILLLRIFPYCGEKQVS